jgi:hypothetical protein
MPYKPYRGDPPRPEKGDLTLLWCGAKTQCYCSSGCEAAAHRHRGRRRSLLFIEQTELPVITIVKGSSWWWRCSFRVSRYSLFEGAEGMDGWIVALRIVWVMGIDSFSSGYSTGSSINCYMGDEEEEVDIMNHRWV